jgi:hypothetical protein
MNLEQSLRKMSDLQRCQFIVLVSEDLTIRARSTYGPSSSEVSDPGTLRALNECQHFLLGVLRRYLFSEEVDIVALAHSLETLRNSSEIGPSVDVAANRSLTQLQSRIPET